MCRHTNMFFMLDIAVNTRCYSGQSGYLRTTRRKNKNGLQVEYYQLAHNERHPESKNSVVRIIHSFGRADKLNREELLRLCQSIARVCDLKIVDLMEKSQESNLQGSSTLGLPKDGQNDQNG